MAAMLAVGPFVSFGCDPDTPPADENSPIHRTASDRDAELVTIATAHLQRHRPEWADVDHLSPKIIVHADHWEVTWRLPPDTLGGTPVVRIDKDTLEVTQAYHTQ